MLLKLAGISKSYGVTRILEAVSFVVNENDRIGLVGPNGAGKSTILKIGLGELEPDAGQVSLKKGLEIGYLPQTITRLHVQTIAELLYEAQGQLQALEVRLRQLESQMPVASEADLANIFEEYSELTQKFEQRGGYDIDYKISYVLDGLGLAYLSRDRLLDSLSGGEKTRVGLAALLIKSPDLLLLDEPTNHLDFVALAWLESYIREHQGALLTVSHDRRFLDKVATHIFELDEHYIHLKLTLVIIAPILPRKRVTANSGKKIMPDNRKR